MTPRVLPVNPFLPESRVVAESVRVLSAGGILVYPTETLYGLGADALNREAVTRVRAAKGRSDGKPILLLADSVERVLEYVGTVSPSAREVMSRFWPGPLTVILPARKTVPEEVTAGTGTVGIRVPDHPLCRELVRSLGSPITSTSANLSGAAPPSEITGLVSLFGDRVSLFLDAGDLPPSPGSTILDLSGDRPRLVREGAFPLSTLTSLLPDLLR